MSAQTPSSPIDDLTFADLLRIALEDLPGASRRRSGRCTAPSTPASRCSSCSRGSSSSGCSWPSRSPSRSSAPACACSGSPARAPARAAVHRPERRGAGAASRSPPARLRAGRRRPGPALRARPTTSAGAAGRTGSRCRRCRRPGTGSSCCWTATARRAGATLSLLVEARRGGAGRARVAARRGRRAPRRRTLRWTAIGPDGPSSRSTSSDGTGGLRRSGLLRAVAGPRSGTASAGAPRLRATVIAGRFTEPVRDRRGRHPNAVVARHRVPGQRRRHATSWRRSRCPARSGACRLPGAAGVLDDGAGDVVLTGRRARRRAPRLARPSRRWVGIGPADRVLPRRPRARRAALRRRARRPHPPAATGGRRGRRTPRRAAPRQPRRARSLGRRSGGRTRRATRSPPPAAPTPRRSTPPASAPPTRSPRPTARSPRTTRAGSPRTRPGWAVARAHGLGRPPPRLPVRRRVPAR